MFTGIIEEVGHVQRVEPMGGGLSIRITCSFADELRVDQSVSVNGVCQTVVNKDADSFDVVAIEETLRKTNFGSLIEGSSVNLERAMRPGDRLDGHLVQGHVDATGSISDIVPEETSRLYRIRFPEEFAPFLIPVGSVAVDGVSLTVARLDDADFTVALIPHTLENTTAAQNWAPGAEVNLEFDLIGKYVSRWMETRNRADQPTRSSRITVDWLREQGF